jgi:hypothetical protein
MTRTNLEASASNGNVERATLGALVEVVDPKTGTTSLEERNATSSVEQTNAKSSSGAKRESAARFRKAEHETIKLSVQVVGDPTLRAKSVIELRGLSSLLSGKYYVNEVKHVVSSSGYVVDLKLTRDASGQRRGLGAAQTGQQQGGQPNRSDAATGGTLTPVEVIDRKNGTSRVEYRRSGQPIGASDPEARIQKPL